MRINNNNNKLQFGSERNEKGSKQIKLYRLWIILYWQEKFNTRLKDFKYSEWKSAFVEHMIDLRP